MLQFFATCPQGLENLLVAELLTLGADQVRGTRGGVQFASTDMSTAYRVCLHSHLSHRLLLSLKTFQATTPDEVYEQVSGIDWSEHLLADGSLLVESKLRDTQLGNPHFSALKVKDAICDQFRAATGERPSVDTVNPDVRLNLFVHKQSAELALDISGGGLRAPGIDTQQSGLWRGGLAAAAWHLGDGGKWLEESAPIMVLGAGDVDVIVTAALLSAGLAPGLYQSQFGFESWLAHVPALWKRLREEAQIHGQQVLNKSYVPRLVVSEEHNISLQAAKQSCARLGLAPLIDWQCTPRLRVTAPASQGLVLVPPPPNGHTRERDRIAQELESRIKREFSGWTVVQMAPGLAPDPQSDWSAPVDRVLSMRRGKTGFRLNRYDGRVVVPRGSSDRSARPQEPRVEEPVLELLDADQIGDGARMLLNRLNKNLKHLGRWARRNAVSCYRLYDADLPEYAAAIDVYHSDETWAVVQEYAPPAKMDEAVAATRLMEIVTMVAQALELPAERIVLKQRKRQRGAAQYEKLNRRGHFHVVSEGPVKLWVNFTDYLDTGVFLDHRSVRLELGERARDKHVLNLFAYTGVATLHMVAGGARSSTTIDLSKTYLDWAQRNLVLNKMQGDAHSFEQADCMVWLQTAAANLYGKRYGLIFMDPPTFSTSKRMDAVLDVQRDHVRLIRDAVKLLRPGGELYFSNNFRRFVLDETQLSDLHIENITARSIPEDFRGNKRIHHCYRITVPK